MTDWDDVLRHPGPPGTDDLADWFDRIADWLLNGCVWVVGGQPLRMTEVEVYYHGAGHPDPFAHRDPVQRAFGRWYFHRTGGTYRGGSFKGVDLTFGDGAAYAGVLVRGVEAPDGTRIDGPSVTVDALIARTGSAGVAGLAAAVGERVAWAEDNPLLLRTEAGLPARPVLRTARVGLSLKRAGANPEFPRYLMRPYRYVADPRRTAKGKVHMVLALYARGVPAEEITRQTGCPRAAVGRYITAYEEGRREADFGAHVGRDLSPADVCRLHGAWAAAFAGPSTESSTRIRERE